MAINSGVNQSKIVAFTPLSIPLGVDVTKIVVFAVLNSPNTNPPVWPAFTFANGVIGVAYSQTWDLTPAASPTTYSVLSGALPTGLSLTSPSGDLGTISGTPTVLGAFSFTLRATNLYGTADKAFTLTIVVATGITSAYVF